jgi:hypothetical protein
MQLSAFRATAPTVQKPARVVTLPRSAWAPSWPDRPEADVEVGLRLPPEALLVGARAEAARKAWRLHPEPADEDGRVEAYNSFVMAAVVAHAACSPEDETAPYFGELAVDNAPLALTADGLQHLFEQLDLFAAETSASIPEADDALLAALADALQTGAAWEGCDLGQAATVRLLLFRAATILGIETE